MKTEENDIEQEWLEAEKTETTRRRSESVQIDQATTNADDEIDLADLIRQIWAKRRTIWITTLIVFFIGIFVALVSPEEYEASVVLMPQSSETNNAIGSNIMRQLGGLAGFGLGGSNNSGVLSPALYPDIIQSTPFFLSTIEQGQYFATLDTTINLTDYFGRVKRPGLLDYVKTYTIGLPRLIIGIPVKVVNALKGEKPSPVLMQEQNTLGKNDTIPNPLLKLTRQQVSVISQLKGRIVTTIEANSTIKISVEMPDPVVASRTTEMAVNYLTNYILEYRTDKAQQDLLFIQKQFREKGERYDAAQKKLAQFRDRNMNIISETARIEQERLESENQLARTLYESLAQQLEQARIKVQEETPVFKVLEPIQVPLRASSPNRELIIALSIFVGLFLGLGIALLQIMYGNIKQSL